jgi:hypothetical protein
MLLIGHSQFTLHPRIYKDSSVAVTCLVYTDTLRASHHFHNTALSLFCQANTYPSLPAPLPLGIRSFFAPQFVGGVVAKAGHLTSPFLGTPKSIAL